MLRKICKSKIHMATVSESELFYEGSITIDQALMEAADIVSYEFVDVWDVNNGERFSTYAIPAPYLSGTICVNGAAARRVQKGDNVIIAAFGWLEAGEEVHSPKIVFVDEKNRQKEQTLT